LVLIKMAYVTRASQLKKKRKSIGMLGKKN